jgi:Lon-like protease
MRRLLGIAVLFGAVLLLVIVAGVPSGYYVITPGDTHDIGPRLRIPDAWRHTMGRLAFTDVYAREGNWGDLVRTWLSGTARVILVEDVRPQGVSQAELRALNRRLTEESEAVAAVVALRAAGYEAGVTGQGAEVTTVVAGMPADGILKRRDVIVSVDGKPVRTAVEVIKALWQHRVGEQVSLGILRDGGRQEVFVGTLDSEREPGRPIIGAAISTRRFTTELPFAVEVIGDDVGGPAAGLMIALGILDSVTPGVLTDGHLVAGTGTIAPDGAVGAIGGVAQKVIAAERDGAELFLVPRDNYEEARRYARAARVVPVDRFTDALNALCALESTSGTPPQSPAPCPERASGRLDGPEHE